MARSAAISASCIPSCSRKASAPCSPKAAPGSQAAWGTENLSGNPGIITSPRIGSGTVRIMLRVVGASGPFLRIAVFLLRRAERLGSRFALEQRSLAFQDQVCDALKNPLRLVQRVEAKASGCRRGFSSAPQHTAGESAGVLESVHEYLAVDQRVLVAGGLLDVPPGAGRQIMHEPGRR